MAKAGLEAALWDLFAKAQGISLSRMLGGARSRIDVGVSIGLVEISRESGSVEDLLRVIRRRYSLALLNAVKTGDRVRLSANGKDIVAAAIVGDEITVTSLEDIPAAPDPAASASVN